MNLNNITNTGTWGQQVTRLNDNFNKVALGIDTLREMYESLSQSAIEVVDTLPQTGEANKIYRLVGTTSYSDYMYNADDLNTPILMATYNNAIDDVPTAGSDNLVKSGKTLENIITASSPNKLLNSFKLNAIINTDDTWYNRSEFALCIVLPIKGGDSLYVEAQQNAKAFVSIVKSLNVGDNQPVDFAEGESRRNIDAGSSLTLTVPSDALFLVLNLRVNVATQDFTPKTVEINGYSYDKDIREYVGNLRGIAFDDIKVTFGFTLTESRNLEGGYFSRLGIWRKEVPSEYGNWRTAVFDVVPNEWYLVNCTIQQNVRIFDVDELGNGTQNESVPNEYYEIASHDTTSWALVKTKYSKLGVNVIDPSVRPTQSNSYQYPKIARLDRSNNDGIVMLFLQLYTMIKKTFEEKLIIVKKDGGADYTSLTRAIMDNTGLWGVTIYLDEGEYDLLSELEEYYGTSDFLSSTPSGRGIELGYDITIKASPKALITAHYTGSSNAMLTNFSPFNCYNAPNVGGFSLIGVRIECSRCRYVIHDEKGTAGTGSYTNLYENCNFKLDNTNNPSWHSSLCIGGGLGHSGNIVIRNSLFESIDPNFVKGAVSYHNNRNTGAKSFISCIGNYIKGNRGFRFTWYGESEEITDILLQGNNVGQTTETGPETSPDSPYGPSLIENISVKEWGTTLRSL